MVRICRLENKEHKSMKQVSYSGKYSLTASRAHQSHLHDFLKCTFSSYKIFNLLESFSIVLNHF